jgi:hypothetical protein
MTLLGTVLAVSAAVRYGQGDDVNTTFTRPVQVRESRDRGKV